MKFDLLIKNGIVVSSDNNFVPYRASIGINNDKISRIISSDKDLQCSAKKTIDASNRVILSGLFNNHVHGDMTMFRGYGDNMTLLEQNKKFYHHNWFYKFIDDKDRYLSRQLTYAESLLNGVTFITENMYWSLKEDSIRAMEEVGIKGALVEDIRPDFNNPHNFIDDDYISVMKNKCASKGYIFVIGGISEEDFDYKLLLSISEKVKKHNLFHTSHLAENKWRHKLISEKFGMSPIKYINKTKILNSKYLGSHVVKVDKEDISILKTSLSNVVSTPICEMKIADGIAPISKMIKEGINVSLGTDGALWNNENDIFHEMKQTALVQSYKYGVKSISTKDILRMATINGAKTYGLDKDYGSVEVGKKASLILIDATKLSWQPIRENQYENITSNLVFNTSGKDVIDVFVDGKHIVQNRKLVVFNVDKLKEELLKTSKKIQKGLKEFEEGKNEKILGLCANCFIGTGRMSKKSRYF